jgi:hypothetical protein
LQKKKQKNSHLLRAVARQAPNPTVNESFLLLFFKKEVLSFLFKRPLRTTRPSGGVIVSVVSIAMSNIANRNDF